MAIKINETLVNNVEKAMEWAYSASIKGIPGLGSAQDLAHSYLNNDMALDKQIDSLIRWQKTKCATSGFIAGLPGILAAPVSIPANISSVIYVQTRMIAAIAYMAGHDIKDDRVQTLIYIALAGNSGLSILHAAGVNVGTRIAENFIAKQVTGQALRNINKAVGMKLVTKFGEKGVINLGKGAPIVGAVVGATIDTLATHGIGKAAKKIFVPEDGLVIEQKQTDVDEARIENNLNM